MLGLRGDIAWLPVVLIAAREFGVSIYRSLAARRGISLPARQLGKWKATVQMLAVGAYCSRRSTTSTGLQQVVLWVAVALTIISGARHRAPRLAGVAGESEG